MGYYLAINNNYLFAFSECTEGEVRLTNGSIPAEGNVELCFEGIWASVCDKGWTKHDAQVVCNQLGYGPNRKWMTKLLLVILLSWEQYT